MQFQQSANNQSQQPPLNHFSPRSNQPLKQSFPFDIQEAAGKKSDINPLPPSHPEVQKQLANL